MAENDSDLLNAVYREISEKLGMDTAMEIYQMFKGQQINFPVRFFNPARIQQIIVKEYDGTNIPKLINIFRNRLWRKEAFSINNHNQSGVRYPSCSF